MNATALAFKSPQAVFVGRGIATVATFGSAAGQIAVHENITHREQFKGTEQAQFRYFVSLEGRMREVDALRGEWWSGSTKSEATARARTLADKINSAATRLATAKTWTMRGADILVQRNEKALAAILAPYSATVEP